MSKEQHDEMFIVSSNTTAQVLQAEAPISQWNLENVEELVQLDSITTHDLKNICSIIRKQPCILDDLESVCTVIKQYNGKMLNVVCSYFAIAYLENKLKDNRDDITELLHNTHAFVEKDIPLFAEGLNEISEYVNNTPKYAQDLWQLFFGENSDFRSQLDEIAEYYLNNKCANPRFGDTIRLCYNFQNLYWKCADHIQNKNLELRNIQEQNDLEYDSRKLLKDASENLADYCIRHGLVNITAKYLQGCIVHAKHLELLIPYTSIQYKSKNVEPMLDYSISHYFYEVHADIEEILEIDHKLSFILHPTAMPCYYKCKDPHFPETMKLCHDFHNLYRECIDRILNQKQKKHNARQLEKLQEQNNLNELEHESKKLLKDSAENLANYCMQHNLANITAEYLQSWIIYEKRLELLIPYNAIQDKTEGIAEILRYDSNQYFCELHASVHDILGETV